MILEGRTAIVTGIATSGLESWKFQIVPSAVWTQPFSLNM